MKLALFTLVLLCLFACSSERSRPVLHPGNLQSFYIRVNPAADTVFRTPKGAAIRIRKGTFLQPVDLEIKEAYTVKDMLLAGLATESNGQPLRSGGMIYINTRDGEAPVLQKPITVLLPANGLEPGMQLFKGEEAGDTINWLQPDTLQPSLSDSLLALGKLNFVSNCATCHAIRKTLTGPALANIQDRGPWTIPGNFYRWVHNPARFIPTTAYTRELQRQFGGQIMPSFPVLSDSILYAIKAFIQNESSKAITDTFRLPAFTPADSLAEGDVAYTSRRPCGDTTYYDERDTPVLSGNTVATLLGDPQPTDTSLPNEPQLRSSDEYQSLRSGFTDTETSDGAYRFEIITLGWYNVDAFVEGQPGTTLCDLAVTLNGEGAGEGMNVYAFFPQQKNLSVGAKKERNTYAFDKINGKIPLYMGEKGIVIAFGNHRDQFYYGVSHFTVAGAQTITVALRPSTEEELLQAIQNEKIEGITMDVVKRQMKVVPCSAVTDSTALE